MVSCLVLAPVATFKLVQKKNLGFSISFFSSPLHAQIWIPCHCCYSHTTGFVPDVPVSFRPEFRHFKLRRKLLPWPYDCCKWQPAYVHTVRKSKILSKKWIVRKMTKLWIWIFLPKINNLLRFLYIDFLLEFEFSR